jgi:hypothetical protein
MVRKNTKIADLKVYLSMSNKEPNENNAEKVIVNVRS